MKNGVGVIFFAGIFRFGRRDAIPATATFPAAGDAGDGLGVSEDRHLHAAFGAFGGVHL